MARLADPIPCPHGYSLHCYCDQDREHPYDYLPHEFFGSSKRQAFSQARKRGWKFHRDNTATCPICNKEPRP